MDEAVLAKLKERFVGALNGDLNTSLAITAVYDVLKAKCSDATKLAALADFDKVLSLNLIEAAGNQKAGGGRGCQRRSRDRRTGCRQNRSQESQELGRGRPHPG